MVENYFNIFFNIMSNIIGFIIYGYIIFIVAYLWGKLDGVEEERNKK